jgi:hypothetical protein
MSDPAPEPDPSPRDDLHCEICGELVDTSEQLRAHMAQDHGAPEGQLATQDNLSGDQAREDSATTSSANDDPRSTAAGVSDGPPLRGGPTPMSTSRPDGS